MEEEWDKEKIDRTQEIKLTIIYKQHNQKQATNSTTRELIILESLITQRANRVYNDDLDSLDGTQTADMPKEKRTKKGAK